MSIPAILGTGKLISDLVAIYVWLVKRKPSNNLIYYSFAWFCGFHILVYLQYGGIDHPETFAACCGAVKSKIAIVVPDWGNAEGRERAWR